MEKKQRKKHRKRQERACVKDREGKRNRRVRESTEPFFLYLLRVVQHSVKFCRHVFVRHRWHHIMLSFYLLLRLPTLLFSPSSCYLSLSLSLPKGPFWFLSISLSISTSVGEAATHISNQISNGSAPIFGLSNHAETQS